MTILCFSAFDVVFANSISSSILLVAAARLGMVCRAGRASGGARADPVQPRRTVVTGWSTLKGKMEHEICHEKGA